MNRWFCHKFRRSVDPGLLICAALAALALPVHAHAQFSGQASATGTYESNTNVFALNSGFSPAGDPNFRRSDTDFSYGAALSGSYLLGRQEFFATASSQEFKYQRYTQLDNTSYNVDLGWKWKLGDNLDGQLDASRAHSMVPFYNLTGVTTLSLVTVTEQRETAQIGIKLNSDWRIKASAFTSKADQPTPDAPNLQLTQSSGTTSLEYSGFGAITGGVMAGYSSGDYSGANGINGAASNPSFSQTTAGLVAHYNHIRSSFDGSVGYSRRTSSVGSDDTSGVTGSLAFTEQVTPKTSFTATIARSINSYILNEGSVIDTTAGVTVGWQATYKLTVSAGYTFDYRNFPKQGNNPVGSDRVDIQEAPTMAMIYRPLRWLVIRPYANIQTRRSTFVGGHFSQNVYGVSVSVSTPEKRHARQ
jgi:hypothetical protein